MTPAEINRLTEKARTIRELTIDQIGYCGFGHIGGSMSLIEILTLLYHKHMDVKPDNIEKRDRDMLILSKGHAGPALYSTPAVMSTPGVFNRSQ